MREVVVAGIVDLYCLICAFNTSEIMNKQINHTSLKEHVDYIYWHPDFHINNKNRLDDSHIDTP